MESGLFAKAMTSTSEGHSLKSEPVSYPPELALLTSKEREILQLIATGHSNKEIARQIYITERTVKNHVNNILHSLDLRDRTQAAIFAFKYLD